MIRPFLIILNIVLFAAIGGSIYHHARHFPVDILNERSNFLQSQDLFFLEQGENTPCSNYWLEQWHRYFLDIAHYAPALSETHGLLGFYEIVHNNHPAALRAIEKAQASNPLYWVNDYNLGVLYFREKDYIKAMAHFQKAAVSDMRLNAYVMTSSKLYVDLIRQAKNLNIKFKDRLQNGNNQCQLGIKACAYAIETGQALSGFNLFPILF